MATGTDVLRQQLDRAGLGGLADQVWDLVREGYEFDYIYDQITKSDTYKRRFSGLVALRESGRAAGLDENGYLQLEAQMRGELIRKGLGDTEFVTNEYLADVIAAEVSPDEFQTRLDLAEAASLTLPGDVRRELQERYGVRQENVVSYYLDTDRVEADLIRQQEAAALAAQYERFQSKPIATKAFEELAGEGVDYAAAGTAFQSLGTLGGGLSDDERLLGAIGSNQAIDRERRTRIAAFRGGGTASGNQEGVAGLGEAGST